MQFCQKGIFFFVNIDLVVAKSNGHHHIVYCLKTYADGQSSTENQRTDVANCSLDSTMSVAA